MRIWNQWWYRQNFLLPTLFLRLMPKYNESCCVNRSRKSQNFLNNRNWPNSAPTLGFSKNIDKGQFCITLDEEGPDDVKTHEDRPSPGCEGLPSLRTSRCWDHDRIFTSRPRFASWTESTNTWPKRQKKFLLQVLRTEVQGNLSRRPNHDQSRL